MIKYFCDVTDKLLTPEQIANAQALALEFAKEQNLSANDFQILNPELFHPSLQPRMKAYWLDKIRVIKELNELNNARIANHRKEFFKTERQQLGKPLKAVAK